VWGGGGGGVGVGKGGKGCQGADLASLHDKTHKLSHKPIPKPWTLSPKL
jgi:hypothetical protein